MAYSDKVIDHYNNPRNVGSMDKNDPHVGTGMVGAPECGDVMKLQVKVNPETGVIEDDKFKTFLDIAQNPHSNTPPRRHPAARDSRPPRSPTNVLLGYPNSRKIDCGG